MKKSVVTAAIGVLAFVPTLAQGQVVSSLASFHNIPADAVTAAADLVSENLYSFRPTDDVRTLGQILAHLADTNYSFCSSAAGEDNPNAESFEETKTTKAEITTALADALAYCQGVYTNMTDEQGAETVPFFGGQDFARSAILAVNSAHNYEHYGNLVTYLRINGITPPTSRGM